jgi:hypothetical protein
MEDDLSIMKMENDLKFFLENIGSCFLVCNIVSTKLGEIWKTTSIFFENGRQTWHLKNGRLPQFKKNGRQPQLFGKCKTISVLKMEDDLIFIIISSKERLPTNTLYSTAHTSRQPDQQNKLK